MFNSKKRVKDMAAPGTSNAPAPSAGNAEKLEIAKRLALRINAQKNLGAEAQVMVPFHFKVRLLTDQFCSFLIKAVQFFVLWLPFDSVFLHASNILHGLSHLGWANSLI